MKNKPMSQQLTALARMEGKRNFGLFMEMGTGKTFTLLADAERCYIGNKIDALAVVAPNGVHANWVRREIPSHMDIPVICYIWTGRPTSKKAIKELDQFMRADPTQALKVFSINVEAVNSPAGEDILAEYVRSHRTMIVVDESTRIKNPSAKRTKKLVEIGREAIARRILTGSPITKAPMDLYSQFDFLKPGLLGTTSYRAFVSEFAELLPLHHPKMQAIIRKGVRGVPQVVMEDENGNKMYRNLDKLSELIAPHTFRIRKSECLDLPPKMYQRIPFQLTPTLRKVYDQLKTEYEYMFNNSEEFMESMEFAAIAARTKMKQVTSGFIMIDGQPTLIADNPRMDTFIDYMEDVSEPCIVWAIYEQEIVQLAAKLREMGRKVCTYYGATSAADRDDAIDGFQGGRYDTFVGNPAAAGIGLTLTRAHLAIYYSCGYDNELRMQSEDRCHRIGTVNKVLYVDLVAEDTIDEDVMRSLESKSRVATEIIDRQVQAA